MRFQVSRIIHYRDNTGGPLFSWHQYLKKYTYICTFCRDNLRHYVLRASLQSIVVYWKRHNNWEWDWRPVEHRQTDCV